MFTEANVETAMCLWEAALELREHATNAAAQTLNRIWKDEGTVQLRHTIIGWVAECEAQWEADRLAGTETEPYDWEHCPAFLMKKLNDLV